DDPLRPARHAEARHQGRCDRDGRTRQMGPCQSHGPDGLHQRQSAEISQARLAGRQPMLKVWGRASSLNVQKAMWTVGELGIAHERLDVGGRFGGLDRPEYLRMNPNAKIPTIDDDGVIVCESIAVVRYLCARYGEGGLWDPDPGVRAQADQ